jgi:hypothetical protein
VEGRKRKRDTRTEGEFRPFRSHLRFQALLEKYGGETRR